MVDSNMVKAGRQFVGYGVPQNPTPDALAFLPNLAGVKTGALKRDQTLGATASGGVIWASGGEFMQNPAGLYWDATNNRLGIGTATPTGDLEVAGTINFPSANGVSIRRGNSVKFSATSSVTSVNDNNSAQVITVAGGKVGIGNGPVATITQSVDISGALCLSGGVGNVLMFGNTSTAPSVIGSGSIFLSGGGTNTVGIWLKGYSGNQVQLGTYI